MGARWCRGGHRPAHPDSHEKDEGEEAREKNPASDPSLVLTVRGGTAVVEGRRRRLPRLNRSLALRGVGARSETVDGERHELNEGEKGEWDTAAESCKFIKW